MPFQAKIRDIFYGTMGATLDNATIRSSSHAELAAYFRTLLLTLDWKPIFDQLLASTVSGAINSEVFRVWVSVCKNPDAIAAAMAQDVSAGGRRTAIKRFGQQLRTDAGFPAIWEAIGGVEGLLALMAQMSANEVDLLCMTIRRSSTARGAVKPRQACMSALFRALQGAPGAPRNPDTRPLGDSHKSITPACSADIALRGVDLTHCVPGGLRYQAHAAQYEAHAMEAMFPEKDGDGKGYGPGQPVSTFAHLMERSSRFTMRVLQRMIREKTALTTEEGKSVVEVSKTLLRKLSRKSAKDDTIKEQAMRLVTDCVRKYPVLADCIECAGPRNLISSAIKVWERAREPTTRARLEESIAVLVSMTPEHTLDNIGVITNWTESVPLPLRPRIMRLLLLHAQHFQVDIESQSPENEERLRRMEPWVARSFLVLPAEHGLKLFEYMLKLRPDGSFLKGDLDKVSDQLRTRVFGPPEHDAKWYEKTANLIVELKKDAASAREWEDRARWASEALSLCVEMKSLDHYENVILWARRFRRDANTVHNFYNSEGFASAAVDLLSGIPLKQSGLTGKSARKELPVSIDQVCSNITKANRIMLLLLETASEALREPSFNRRDWFRVLQLPVHVVRKRLDHTDEIRKMDKFNEETLYHNIWKPTVEFLVQFERFGLESGRERLVLLALAGPFVGLLSRVLPEVPQPATYAFLNEMAQRRDELWRQIRVKEHPSVASLGSPWPRGLPVQFLCPETHWEHIPYLQARAEKILFADGPAALEPIPEDEELREAIGPFVDSYKYALQVYIQSGTSDEDRYARIRRAWQHAVTKLSDPAMSEEEIPRFWRDQFSQTLLKSLKIPLPNELAPVRSGLAVFPGFWRDQFNQVIVERLKLPFLDMLAPVRPAPIPVLPRDTCEGPSEWNPEPDYKSDQEPSQKVPPTYLSAILSQDYRYTEAWKTSCFRTPVVSTIGNARPHIFNRFGDTRNSQPLPDSVIAAALSYTNTKYGSDTSFLLQPFPSRTEVRYPAFYLDQEFLDLASKDTDWSTVVLICQAAPTPILARLADSLIARLVKDPAGVLEVRYAAVNIIKRISRGDHPAAACGLIQKVVLDLPADSSWHRHLLSVSFLRRLPAMEARTFLSGLASQIRHRLGQWPEQRKDEKKERHVETTKEEGSGRNFVKVTTVKMVAQMLRDATYVDKAFACDILVDLLTTVKQGDIQIAAIDSLISMLGTGPQKEPGVDAVVFNAIEQHVVPIAASLNEKDPMPAEEWHNDKIPPKVYDDGVFGHLPPVLQLLVQARHRWKEGTAARHEWVSRVLVPVVEQSAANNHRWVKIFVARHSLDIDVDSLPRLPVKPALLLDLFGEPEFYTRANFETLKRYTWTVLQMPESQRHLKAFEEDRKGRPNVKQSNEAAQWLHLWPSSISDGTGCSQVVRQLQIQNTAIPSDPGNDSSDRLSPQELGAFILEVADRVIEEARTNEFNYLVGAVGTIWTSKAAWLATCLPLLEEMVARVDGRRTEEWQRDPDRKPATLPETLGIKLRILELKHQPTHSSPSSPDKDAVFRAFAADVAGLIDELIDSSNSYSRKPYHETWPALKTKALGIFRSHGPDVLHAALALAPPQQSRLGLAELLRIELADEMLRSLDAGGRQDPRLVQRARALLRSWVRSPVERVRARGVDTAGQLRRMAELDSPGAWFGAGPLEEEGAE
ncbi:hypothetical protein SLS62_006519 [Diatrype stigma]|uniref:Uncharacterized protein n=1 Tax=Diatrype stigma TaxID=117547 RepID=A0AAN9UMJ4_9PEZI